MMLVHHLTNLKDSALAKQVWLEQRRCDWPGLAREVSFISKELGLEDINETELSKNALKRLVSQACREKNEQDLKADMVGKSKLTALRQEDCNVKPYICSKSLQEVRDTFRVRTQMTNGFKGNFSNMYKGGNMKCEGCEQVLDTQSHATECPAYSDLREGLNLTVVCDLVTFFRRVMERRTEKDD